MEITVSKVLENIDKMLDEKDKIGAAMVVKITEKAIADVQKVIYKAAKRAAKADNKPEGRMREWIAGKVQFAMKQWR
jgi:hypothetical protein